MPLSRIDLRQAAPQAVQRFVAAASHAIQHDALVVLPTETVYGLAADPARPSSVARLLAWKGRPDAQPFTHHLARAADATALAAPLSRAAQRLAARYWPGPLTLVVADRQGGEVGLRVPAQAFTQQVIAACGKSLFLTSVNRSGAPPLLTPDAIVAGCSDSLDLLYDDGPPPLQLSSTVVRVTRDGMQVMREGILTQAEVFATGAATVLFVCTGNTCRSPMAEVLARRLAADKLGVEPGAVLARGLRFVSAGIGAAFGEPASEGAVAAAAEVGCDLDGHVAQPLSAELVAQAERVYCMTTSHAARVRARVPEAGDKVQLLRRDGTDVGDPFGQSLVHYRQARDEIGAALRERWDEIAGLV
jgi:protein-tyrosine phosphatase